MPTTSMGVEEVLKLFDSYWFEHGIFTKKPPSSPPVTNPVHQTHVELEEPKLSCLPTHHVRSLSDHVLSSKSSFTSDSLSPNSVLLPPNLQTILSEKEVREFSDQIANQEEIETPIKKEESGGGGGGRRRKLGSSKSLSELEFEELKGFMDLGFVFSEEDKESSLVSIIPGLHRLGRKGDDEDVAIDDEYVVSRPYLSEAWAVLDQRKENPLMHWRVPALGSEIDMKDHLRFWAHTVASTVR